MKCRGSLPVVVLAMLALADPATGAAQMVTEASARITAAGGVTVGESAFALARASSRGVTFALSATVDGAAALSMPGFILIREAHGEPRPFVLEGNARQAWTGTTASREMLSLSFRPPTGTPHHGFAGPVGVLIAQYN